MLRLETSTPGALAVVLRPLSGEDERRLHGDGLRAALSLIARLLDGASEGALQPRDLPGISVADFDRVLAALHRRLYGPRLECQIGCTGCGEPLEFSVSLDDLMARPGDALVRSAAGRPGWFLMEDGRAFRLPTLQQLLGGIPRERLIAECLAEPEPGVDSNVLEAAFAEAGPLASETVESSCPACGIAQTARVDLADYVVAMLRRERPFLLREVHVLARAYGWGLGEILSLPRDDRRSFVRLVDAEAAGHARAGRKIA